MEVISPLLSDIITNLVSKAASFVADQVDLVLGVKEDAERLQNNLQSIKDVLPDAEKRQANEQSVRVWLGKLQDAAYNAEDILETFATEAALWKKNKRARDCIDKFETAQKIKGISKRLKEIYDEKDNLHLDGRHDLRLDEKSESLDEIPKGDETDTSGVCGRENDKVELRELLLSGEEDETSIIPIIGMGGLGKTTLARLLYNDDQVKEHFQAKSWVTVSDSDKLDLTRILRDMFEILSGTKDVTNLSQSQLKSDLKRILSKNRFLLVLDDVWTADCDKWESFLKLVQQGCRGSKVLLTSRDERIAQIMGTQSPYRLKRLPENECWSLFEKIAFNHSNASEKSHLEKIGRPIVGKCKGLPLAVKAMASLLRGVDQKHKWERILRNEIWELEGQSSGTNGPNILPALKISYNLLDRHLKPCFAYCSIFPKAYLFEEEELVKVWISQGFIQRGGKDTEEETGNAYFQALLSRCFFQRSAVVIGQEGVAIDDGEKEIRMHIEPDGRSQEIVLVRYQMHDLIHDLAQSISDGHCCQIKSDECNSRITTPKHRHVSLLCEDVEQPVLSIAKNSEDLRTLLFPSECLRNFGRALEKIFQKLKYLRLLDLSNSTLLELPSSIEELKLLRYLDLSKTEIKQLPNSICNLYNLQTLKLLGCLWLFKLPNDLGELVCLRYLELDEMFWFKCSKLPPSIGRLTFLHNLHAFRVGHKRGYGIEELKNMAYLTGTLHISELENAVSGEEAKLSQKKNLDKLVLEWSKRDVNPQSVSDEEKLLKDLQPHSNLEELCILNYMGNSLPDWMAGGLLQNLHTMTLNGCTGCRTLSLAQISSLCVLSIKGMPELEKWSDESCMSLIKLKISCCKKLSEVPKFFHRLTHLKIKKCCSLKSLPVCAPSLQYLILVDNIVLEDVDKAMRVIDQSDEGHNIRFDNPVLEDVDKEMRVIDQSDEGPSIIFYNPVLEDVHIEMRVIDPSDEGFSIQFDNPVLGDVGQEMKAVSQSDEGRISQILRLVLEAINQFDEGLTMKFPIILVKVINCPKLQALPNYFAPYKLEIRGCPALSALTSQNKLTYLVLDKCCDRTFVEAISDASSLTSLVICNISNLTTFPRWPNLQRLKALYITGCNNLVSLSGEGSLKSLSSLELLSIRECSNLEELPHEGLPTAIKCLIIVSCSNLKSLGTNGTLKSLNSFTDLHIEHCPLLLSFPDDGLPTSLQHLLIQKCPSLAQQCGKKGLEWPKISHIPDLEID